MEAAETRASKNRINPTAMTDNQTQILKWLAARAIPLAELFDGACSQIVAKTPGWTRYSAHAIREIITRLPLFMEVPDEPRFEYHKHVVAIRRLLREADVPATSLELAAKLQSDVVVPVSASILQKLVELVELDEAREQWIASRDGRIVTAILSTVGYSGPPPILAANQWKELRQWGPSRAHASKLSDSDLSEEVEARFREFEEVLFSLVNEAVPALAELDEILDIANR